MADGENTITDLKRYLSTEDRPVTMQEFKDFWETCTEDEKVEFKQTKLE
jgi:hypothetical protein